MSRPSPNTDDLIRVGHAIPNPHPFNVATMHPVNKMHKSKHGCAGSFRAKAMQISDWIKQVLRLPHANVEVKPVSVSDGSVHTLPVIHPSGRPNYHQAHTQTFVQRLSRALMMLGPWEGRAVSFVLGKTLHISLFLISANNFWYRLWHWCTHQDVLGSSSRFDQICSQ